MRCACCRTPSPSAASDVLLWRHSILPLARARAHELGLAGAAFPWRTIRGEECSGYWPAGTAAFHINADIADAVRRYVLATGDVDFEAGPGLELLVETARLWRSLGHHDAEGCFRIDGVTGPDEYSALGGQQRLHQPHGGAEPARGRRGGAALPAGRGDLEVGADEVEAWRAAADAMVVPFDDELGVTSQSEGFTRYRRWDFEATPPEAYPLLLHRPYYLLYSSQVVKQADLVFALYCCGDQFDVDQKRRDFAFYEPITVRDSTLSASIQAIVAAEVGHVDLADEYFRETAFVDLRDLAGNTADGLHLASLAGAWLVAVAGFGGMRDHGRHPHVRALPAAEAQPPVLPADVPRPSLKVEIVPGEARYELVRGDPIEIVHHGERTRLDRSAHRACCRGNHLGKRTPVGPAARARAVGVGRLQLALDVGSP